MRYLAPVDPSATCAAPWIGFFDDSYSHHANWRMFDGTLSAKVDIHQDDDNLCLTASLPPVPPEDIEITLSGQALTISGEVKAAEAGRARAVACTANNSDQRVDPHAVEVPIRSRATPHGPASRTVSCG